MTLWEPKESNGKISILEMFNNSDYDIDGLQSDIKLEDLFFRGMSGQLTKMFKHKV